MNDLALAYRLAEEAHEGQIDKIGMPYFHHVRAVSELVQIFPSYRQFTEANKINAIIVGVLHDIVEDTDYTLEYLNNHFDRNIIDGVKLLTFDKTITRVEYYKNIIVSPVARLVKTADLAHNNLYNRRFMLDEETQTRLELKYAKAIDIIVKREDIKTFNTLISK